jgi:hypothetical protein
MSAELITTLITGILGLTTAAGATITLLHERGLEIMKALRSALRRRGGKS